MGERVKKKGSCGGFPNLRTYEIEHAVLQLDVPARDILRFLLVHGLKWRGYVIWGSSWGCPFSFFPFFFLFLGSWLPQINLLSPESALERFLESPSRRCTDLGTHCTRCATPFLSLGRTERRMDTPSPLGMQPTIGSVIWGLCPGGDPLFRCWHSLRILPILHWLQCRQRGKRSHGNTRSFVNFPKVSPMSGVLE